MRRTQSEESGDEHIPILPVPGTAGNAPEVLNQLLPASVEARSDSTSLIDKSAGRLFGTLETMKISTREEIESAVKLAKEIRELGKLKLDIAKTAHEMSRSRGRFT